MLNENQIMLYLQIGRVHEILSTGGTELAN